MSVWNTLSLQRGGEEVDYSAEVSMDTLSALCWLYAMLRGDVQLTLVYLFSCFAEQYED